MLPSLVLCAVVACLAIAAIHERRAARREEVAEKVRERPEEAPSADAGHAGNPSPPGKSSAAAGPSQAENARAGGGLAPPNPSTDGKAKIEALKQESLAVANRLREDFPDNLDALGLVGNVQYYHGNTAQAAECWEQCLRRDPRRVGFYDALAKLALSRAEDEKAVEWCRQGLAQDPDAPHLHGRLGEARTGLGRLEEAVPELERETRISPTYAEGHFLLGQAYSLLHEYQKAKTCHETAVKLDAKQSKYEIKHHRALANACAKLGLDEEAQQQNESIGAMSDRAPSFDDLLDARKMAAKTCGNAAAVYRSQRKISKAEELLTRAAALDAKNTDYRSRLVAIFQESGRDPKAAEVCKELIELEPNNAVHHVELGFFYARMGQFDAARKAAQRALELAPDNPLCRNFHEQMQRAPK
jgi:tetratricopeptide (TPR) repeat protein